MNTILTSEQANKILSQSIDFHCHGVGRFDFTEIADINLQEIENILSERNQRSILTLYLPKPSFDNFLNLINSFDEGKKAGRFNHIMGFGLEGPLLASHGGTPEKGVWSPSKEHWKRLSECGKKGLIYIIFSPDAKLPTSNFENETTMPSITWITETLLEGGVLPAPGHFTKTNPTASARELQTVFDIVSLWGHCSTITDHLYNDMPHNFKHAWRTPEEKQKRNEEIKKLNLANWKLENIEENLGTVPAVMINYARKGIVKICQNFDGEHVDLAVVKRTIDLVGAENMLMMTDSIESKKLAGRNLHMHEGSTLLYQDDDIVAAGSQGVNKQISNMFEIGLSPKEISLITGSTPESIIKKRNQYISEIMHDKTACV